MRSVFPKLSSPLIARALAAHRALGLVLAALLYLLAISGVLSVFNHELQRWEQPGAPEMQSISPAAVQRAAAAMLASEPTTHFYVQLPTWDLPRTVLTTDTQAVFADARGGLGAAESHPWTQFILDLHYYLNLPGTIGLTVVGMLGAMLVGLTLTGLIGHPRILKDAFRFRFSNNERLTQADIHNRLAVWSSPFIISNALSGAMLGLAVAISASIAVLDYGGEVEAVYAPVFGEEPAENEAAAPLANIAGALDHMQRAYPDTDPVYVLMHEPKTEGQHLQILSEHPQRLIFGDYYNFNGDGEFLANVGMSDGAVGQQVAASVYRLHFGSFGGMPIKIAYGIFGIALAIIICAGMNIYFIRRRERAGPAPRLESAWASVVWGMPAALALTLALSTFGLDTVLKEAFWLALLVAIGAGAAIARPLQIAAAYRVMASLLLATSLGVHLIRHADAFMSPAAVSVTIVGFAAAVAFAAPTLSIVIRAKKLAINRGAHPAE